MFTNSKSFDQNKYQQEYNKKNYSTFKVDLKKEEKEKLDILLATHNLTKATFLRNAIKDLEKMAIKKKRGI